MSWTCKWCGWANEGKKCASCGKMKPRAKKGTMPRSRAPHACVLLGLDTASTTGWAISVGGMLESHGEHKLYTPAGIVATQAVLDKLSHLSALTSMPIAAVSERSWGGAMGLGRTTSFGYWLHALGTIGVPLKRIVEVYPSQWRAVELPGHHRAKRDEVRELEQQRALDLTGIEGLGKDEAPAILINRWGQKSGEIGAVL